MSQYDEGAPDWKRLHPPEPSHASTLVMISLEGIGFGGSITHAVHFVMVACTGLPRGHGADDVVHDARKQAANAG